eukprot:6361927-Amphidinium_carterae.1
MPPPPRVLLVDVEPLDVTQPCSVKLWRKAKLHSRHMVLRLPSLQLPDTLSIREECPYVLSAPDHNAKATEDAGGTIETRCQIKEERKR